MVRSKVTYSRLTPLCIVCDKRETDGYFVCNHYLCSACESEIVATDVKEPSYHHYVEQVRLVSKSLTL